MRSGTGKSLKLFGLLVVIAFIVSGVNSRKLMAQQMGDMPYDLHFIDMMIMHHQDGIEMARLAETKAAKAAVKAFGQKTATEQQKDIDELQRYRNQWYAGKPLMDHSMMESMMKQMHRNMKMDMEETRRKLRASTGTAFDRLFLDTMIHHHMMGVEMAKDATTKAEHVEIKEFAQKTVTKQTAEIAELNRLKRGSTVSKTRPKPKASPTHKH